MGERLILPGRRVRIVWATGDATLTKIATVDWTHGTTAVNDFLPYLETLKQCVWAHR